MKVLEAEMKALEKEMPQIDQANISQIKNQAKQLKKLLIEIADTI